MRKWELAKRRREKVQVGEEERRGEKRRKGGKEKEKRKWEKLKLKLKLKWKNNAVAKKRDFQVESNDQVQLAS